MGSYVSIINNTNNEVKVKFSANGVIFEDVFRFRMKDSPTGSRLVDLGSKFLGHAESSLLSDGYVKLQPGQKHTSSKWSLSLLMQANVIYPSVQEGVLFGRKSVWTAPTDGDTYDYNVTDCSWQFWDKNGWRQDNWPPGAATP